MYSLECKFWQWQLVLKVELTRAQVNNSFKCLCMFFYQTFKILTFRIAGFKIKEKSQVTTISKKLVTSLYL